MGGDGHDGPGAVGGQHIVRDKDGNFSPIDGVDCRHPLEHDAGLLLVGGQLGALEVGLLPGLFHIGGHLVPVLQLVLPLLHKAVFWGNDHIGRAKEGVGPGGEDHDVVPGGGLEGDLRAGGPANPVALLGLDPVDKVHGVQPVNELLGVGGNLQHPLGFLLADYRRAAPLADALDDLLVSQHALAGGAPVHRHGGLIGQTVLVQLEENPLSPLVVIGVSGVHTPVPVEGVAQHVELPGEVFDVLLGDDGGGDVVFDGEVLGGQAEGIVADGQQDIVAVHPLLPGDHVHGGVGPGVAHMEPGGGGIGELHQAVELGPGIAVFAGEGLFVLPAGLPLLFDGGKIVLQSKHSPVSSGLRGPNRP